MPDLPDVFERTRRCVLGFAGRRGPLIAPMAFWSDGAELWMSTPAASVKAKALRVRPDCAVYLPPPGGAGPGAVARGKARIYGLHDPIGVAVHGLIVSAAMGALAARNAGTILGYVQDARYVPERFRPHNRVAVRIRLDDVRTVDPPAEGGGIAPALPAAVSPAVRRALSGKREVAVARQIPGTGVVVEPAVWGAGFGLTLPDGAGGAGGVGQAGGIVEGAGGAVAGGSTPAAVYLGTDPEQRPTQVMGLSLVGTIDGGALRPQRATWWEGFSLTTIDLPATQSSITLPD